MPTFSYAIVRYDSLNLYAVAVIVFYAVSLEQASCVLQTLVNGQQCFDQTAIYAIREKDECGAFPSIYPCVCGGTIGVR